MSSIDYTTPLYSFLFFFNDTATTEIYTLSLHDALPIWTTQRGPGPGHRASRPRRDMGRYIARRLLLTIPVLIGADRKSTRLNSSHANISYAVFCLKKKKTTIK